MFKGSIVAIVTPMLESGEIDYDSFAHLLDWHLSNGTDGVVVLGTTGESATVKAEERKKLIELAVERIKGRVPVIVGTGTCATEHSIEMTQQAQHLGADAGLLVTPYYNKPTQEGLYQHYKTIAEAVTLPLILYNVPARTGCDLLPETVFRLAQISNIVAVKEATGDLDRLKQFLAEECELDLLSGDDKTALDFLLAGGKGVISVAANVAPRVVHEMCVAVHEGDVERAQKINHRLEPLYTALFTESNPIPTKWALSLMQMIPNGIRLPLTPLANHYHNEIQQALTQVGL